MSDSEQPEPDHKWEEKRQGMEERLVYRESGQVVRTFILLDGYDPMDVMDRDTLKQLTESVRKKGTIQPIIYTRDGYVIDGWKRLKIAADKNFALSALRLDDPMDVDRPEAEALRYVVNVLRGAEQPIEKRDASLYRLHKTHDLSYRDIERATGVSSSTVGDAIKRHKKRQKAKEREEREKRSNPDKIVERGIGGRVNLKAEIDEVYEEISEGRRLAAQAEAIDIWTRLTAPQPSYFESTPLEPVGDTDMKRHVQRFAGLGHELSHENFRSLLNELEQVLDDYEDLREEKPPEVAVVSEISFDDLLEGDLLDELSDIGHDEEGENDDLTKTEFMGMFG